MTDEEASELEATIREAVPDHYAFAFIAVPFGIDDEPMCFYNVPVEDLHKLLRPILDAIDEKN